MLIAVTPHKMVRGVDGPEGYDWRDPANEKGVRAHFRVTHLANALAQQFRTHAHLVPYVLYRDGVPCAEQPRVNKAGLEYVESEGYEVSVEVLFADVDNEGHRPWTAEELITIEAKLLEQLPHTAGFYLTRHGYRIMQPLNRRVPVAELEGILRAWLLALATAGIEVDAACVDWTRLFALPNVVRDGSIYKSPVIHTARMVPIAPPAPIAVRAGRGKKNSLRPRGDVDVTFATDLPATHLDLVQSLAAAMAGQYQGERHDIGLSLSGALLQRRVAPEHVPAIVRESTRSAGWDGAHHEQSARDTVRGWLSRDRGIKGAEALPPEVMTAVDPSAPRWDAPPATVSLDEATHKIERALRDAPDGCSMIRAGCGTGKTRAARMVAAERAGKSQRLDVRTSIAVPTNELAKQVQRDLHPLPVLRLFGPASVRRPDGKPECRYHDAAVAIAAGGQSVRFELCRGAGKDPCDHYDDCAAREGMDGDESSKVVLGTHAMMGELDAAAGKTGLFALDEPSAYLVDIMLTRGELADAMARVGMLENRYATAMSVAIDAATSWLDCMEPGTTAKPADILDGVDPDLEERMFDATGHIDLIDALGDVLPTERRGTAPPLSDQTRRLLRRVRSEAVRAGEVSRVAHALWRALTAPEGRATIRVEGDDDRKVLVITIPNEALEKVVRREGSVVVMAADAHLYRPVLEQIVGYEPPMVDAHAGDGAAIVRLHVDTTKASRRAWWPAGKLDRAVVGRCVDAALAALKDASAKSVAWVTFMAAESTIKSLVPSHHAVGHYGGLRGLDRWKDVDALVTVGDPWPNLSQVDHEVAWLGLAGGTEARAEDLCRAELEQAHGRLRTAHRQRPGLCIHVGRVLPGGWDPQKVVGRRLGSGGRPPNEGGLSPPEIRQAVDAVANGSPTRAAKIFGCSRRALTDYLRGARPPPMHVVESISRVLRSEV